MQPLPAKGAADQPPATGLTAWGLWQMFKQTRGTGEWSDPEQSAQATAIQDQMKAVFEFEAEIGEPFEGEQVSTEPFGVSSMAEAFELALLAWS